MAPSVVSMSMSAFLMSRSILRNVLESLRQTSADLNRANEIRLLIHDMVFAYCTPFLIAMSSANRLWYLKHSLPIPPVVVKTKGVNVPCSMSRTLLEYNNNNNNNKAVLEPHKAPHDTIRNNFLARNRFKRKENVVIEIGRASPYQTVSRGFPRVCTTVLVYMVV